jgi:hypothetical protein
LTLGLPLFGYATGQTFTQSNTTLQDITGMAVTIGASATEVWLIQIFAEFTGVSGVADLKLGWNTMPSGATMRWGPLAYASGVTGSTGGYHQVAVATDPQAMLTETGSLAMGGQNLTFGVALAGKVLGGGTGGSVQFQGCQNTSSATNMSVLAGSVLISTKIKA